MCQMWKHQKVTLKGNEGVSCEVCGTPMQPVPAEYLMPNGNFFKSQDTRQNFISAIQSSDTYDPEIGGKKEEVPEGPAAHSRTAVAQFRRLFLARGG